MTGTSRTGATLPAAVLLLLLLLAPAGRAKSDPATAERFGAWRKDLDYLYEEIEKAKPLREIFEVKGIDWRKVRAAADRKFGELKKEALARPDPDEAAERVGFYDVLRFVIAQLRDTHAFLRVEEGVAEAWRAAQPQFHDVGVELLPGAFDTVLVANVFPARRSRSPLMGRGVTHAGTILESVDGVDAHEYFEEKARKRFAEEGGESTLGRAYVEALYDLEVAEGKSIELVFRELDVPEPALRQYAALPEKQRSSAFRKLRWKTKKVGLSYEECAQTRNPRNFRFLNLPRPELAKTFDPGVLTGTLGSGTGYVLYAGVSEKSRRGLEEACRGLADRPAMILDLRVNSGGGGSGIEVFDRSKGLWDKPVAVLIGPKAMSAAETELWSLKALRDRKLLNARFFGRTTAGASGAKARFTLPSGFAEGQFVCRHWHGGESRIEGAGIGPDEAVDQDAVDLALGVDSVVAAAERWLRELSGERR